MENNCTQCKYFISWFDYMNDGDELEPRDEGKCDHDDNDDENDLVCPSIDFTCNLFEEI